MHDRWGYFTFKRNHLLSLFLETFLDLLQVRHQENYLYIGLPTADGQEYMAINWVEYTHMVENNKNDLLGDKIVSGSKFSQCFSHNAAHDYWDAMYLSALCLPAA